jgi:hypothetical protein
VDTIVKINGKDYTARMRRGGTVDSFDAVFTPVGSKSRTGILILYDCIHLTTGGVRGGMGPFGSPVVFVKMYDVRRWGKTEYIDSRAWQCLADQVESQTL